MAGIKQMTLASIISMGVLGNVVYASDPYIFSSYGGTYYQDINDAGQIVGNSGLGGSPISTFHSYILDASVNYSSIDMPNGAGTIASGINNKGDVVGYYAYNSSYSDSGVWGFLKSGQDWVYPLIGIESGNFPWYIPTGINDNGVIAGYVSSLTGDHGFIKTESNLSFFDVPDSTGDTSPQDINNLGQVVGFYGSSDNSGQYYRHGFIKTGDSYFSINVPNAIDTFAYGINDLGDVVGSFVDQNRLTHGFVFSNGDYSILDYPGFSSGTQAKGINNNGVIVGYGGSGYSYLGFIATPSAVPLPGSIGLFTSGLGLLLFNRRKKIKQLSSVLFIT